MSPVAQSARRAAGLAISKLESIAEYLQQPVDGVRLLYLDTILQDAKRNLVTLQTKLDQLAEEP